MPQGHWALPVQTASVSGVPRYNVRANLSNVPAICAAVKKKRCCRHQHRQGNVVPAPVHGCISTCSTKRHWENLVACVHPSGNVVPQPGEAGSLSHSQYLSCETALSPSLLQGVSPWRNQHEWCQGQESPSTLSHQSNTFPAYSTASMAAAASTSVALLLSVTEGDQRRSSCQVQLVSCSRYTADAEVLLLPSDPAQRRSTHMKQLFLSKLRTIRSFGRLQVRLRDARTGKLALHEDGNEEGRSTMPWDFSSMGSALHMLLVTA